ncbi:Dyp-type peroxidase [Geodermatophilus poikilotrophus]|uniref:Dyp-type peroxidase n=1 Tax=Geodermatophilus poikilotrophus TaxID=1333667 RepID=UPI000B88D4A8|nr:Dyp-type peroxidase [Geodermatophilus poikilotrophus]
MQSEATVLDRSDIQGFVLRGYRMPHAAYLFYRFTDGPAARAWLAGMVDPVTTAEEWDAAPSWCANVALTYPGLEALGLPTESLDSFPADFRQGMAARAAEHLGDVGDDLPGKWEPEPPFASRGVHAMLMLSAHDGGELDQRVHAFRERAGAAGGLEEVGCEHAAALGGAHAEREHFGFRDGISQPVLRGSGLEEHAPPGRPPVEPGEFLLGHPDERDAVSALHPALLGRNGTYAVYRKLSQDVPAFRRYLDAEGRGDPDLLAAKLMGRWPSGAPLALAERADDSVLASCVKHNNAFDYVDDELGFRCPRGAHVRRAHPRTGSPSERRHLLIRRGLPYGPELADGASDDGADRGLVGVFLNASIERQYEFVQREWINAPDFDGLRNDPDPIAGPGGGTFTWQGRPPRWLRGLPRFVTVRGGEYFFVPSITALRLLSDTPAP